MKAKILELEEKLRLAMHHSDIGALNDLLAENLIFTNHLGQVISKAEDIDSHKRRIFVIDSLELSNLEVIDLGNSAVVTARAAISGSYSGSPTQGKFRFTRVWSDSAHGWQVIAGHSSVIV